MERKVLHSIDVLVLYNKLCKATYPMKTHLCDLDLDNMTLQEAKHKMRLAVGIQKEVEKSYLTYFKDHGSLKSDDAMSHPHMTQAWTAGFHFEQFEHSPPDAKWHTALIMLCTSRHGFSPVGRCGYAQCTWMP